MPAVGDDPHAQLLRLLRTIGHGRNLRHADAADHARGADGTGADTDLDAVGACADQVMHGFLGGHVAADDGQGRERHADALHHFQHALAVAMRRIHDNHIHPRRHERPHALKRVVCDAHGRAAQQPAVDVLGAVGILTAFSMSLVVISPTRLNASSTSGSFSMRYFARMRLASERLVPAGAVIRFSLVITSPIG